MAKLSDEDAAAIRASGLTVTELAVQFNVSKATISQIRSGKIRPLPNGRLTVLTDGDMKSVVEQIRESPYTPTLPLEKPTQLNTVDNQPNKHTSRGHLPDIMSESMSDDVYRWVPTDEGIEHDIHYSDILYGHLYIENRENVRNLKNSLRTDDSLEISEEKPSRLLAAFPSGDDEDAEDADE